MRLDVLLPMLLVAAATSYLTLIAAATDVARAGWWMYAVVTFVLAVGNLWATKR